MIPDLWTKTQMYKFIAPPSVQHLGGGALHQVWDLQACCLWLQTLLEQKKNNRQNNRTSCCAWTPKSVLISRFSKPFETSPQHKEWRNLLNLKCMNSFRGALAAPRGQWMHCSCSRVTEHFNPTSAEREMKDSQTLWTHQEYSMISTDK